MRWKERRKYGRLEHLASARCLFGACYRTAFGLQSDCRDMAWTIMTLAPCVHNARSPVTISLWCARSVVSYGTNASIAAAGITFCRLQVTDFQDGGFDRGSKYPRHEEELSTYRGLVPRVPRVTDYDPKIWIRPVPSSDTWLGNQALRTE
jgi:hypothetical protein